MLSSLFIRSGAGVCPVIPSGSLTACLEAIVSNLCFQLVLSVLISIRLCLISQLVRWFVAYTRVLS